MVNKTVNVFLGLGSNQGNKRKNIDLSKIYITNIPNTKILNTSSIYESVFYGHIKQPTFFNQVVEVSTRLSPELLLMKCLAIENKMGRLRSKQGGSRNIDINIRLDQDLLPGMIFLPFCFRESAANILTNSELDPIGKIPELKFSAARAYQN